MNAIERVAVIGSGVMGGGIAAHLANAGASVLLLDVAAKDGPDRSAVARAAVARLAKSAPPAFMHRRAAGRIDAGNLEDDLSRAGEADWIVEAVVERLDVKRDLYARLDAVRKPGAIVSSNTSTIPLARLTEGASAALQRDFAITHFFNPPRYMRLLEIVRGPATRPELVDQLRDFADRRLGKGVVECKDTPGFIANRIGVFWLQCALIEAIEAGLGVEQADAALGPAAGIPKTGVFGLLDLIGLDLMPHVAGSMDALLPPGDALRRYMEVPEVLRRMVAGGYTGRKGKGGFYRLRREGGERIKESIDLATGEYRRSERARLACVEATKTGGPRALVEHDSEEGRYAWRVLSSVLAYSASLVPEISDDVAGVDAAMRLGYNWRAGPFELADRLGPGRLADRLRAEGRSVPPLLEAACEGGFYREAGGRIEQIRAIGIGLIGAGPAETGAAEAELGGIGAAETSATEIGPSGTGAAGADPAETGTAGTGATGVDPTGTGPAGVDSGGIDAAGTSATEIGSAGTDPAGGYVPIVPPHGIIRLADVKRGRERVIGNDSASLWDAGRDVACLEFHSRMNTLDQAVLELIGQALDIVPDRFAGLVIHNDGENFSAGANLGEALFAIGAGAWDRLAAAAELGQGTFKAMKYAPFPVVGAPAGMALGGGCEVLLHCDAIVAHAETYAGLVETGVGLVPAWGGCKELLARYSRAGPGGPMPPVSRAFETVSLAKVSRSAHEARDLGILRRGDVIVMNRDRVLAEAIDKVHALSPGYAPPEPPVFNLPGPSGKAALALAVGEFARTGKATAHDVVVADALARVLTGGNADLTDEVGEEALLALEREAVFSLMRTEGTRARIEHMLETGKPLRN